MDAKRVLSFARDAEDTVTHTLTERRVKPNGKRVEYDIGMDFIHQNRDVLFEMLSNKKFGTFDYHGVMEETYFGLLIEAFYDFMGDNDEHGGWFMECAQRVSAKKRVELGKSPSARISPSEWPTIHMDIMKYMYDELDEPGYFKDLMLKNIIQSMVLTDWLYNKQVFEISDDLGRELIDTTFSDSKIDNNDTAVIDKTLFENLPFNSYCIDLSNNKQIGDGSIDIIFVGVFMLGNDVYLHLRGEASPTNTVGHSYRQLYKLNELVDDTGRLISITIKTRNKEHPDADLTGTDESLRLGLASILYLSSEKPDVKESMETSNTHRVTTKFSRPKHRYSELQKWDIGFRYADSIKKCSEISSNETMGEGTGSPKRPHVRKAHWHHYWVGTGSMRRLILKWVAPMFIHAEFDSELPVVCHREM